MGCNVIGVLGVKVIVEMINLMCFKSFNFVCNNIGLRGERSGFIVLAKVLEKNKMFEILNLCGNVLYINCV